MLSPLYCIFLGCRRLILSNTLVSISLKAPAAKICEYIIITDDLVFTPRKQLEKKIKVIVVV